MSFRTTSTDSNRFRSFYACQFLISSLFFQSNTSSFMAYGTCLAVCAFECYSLIRLKGIDWNWTTLYLNPPTTSFYSLVYPCQWNLNLKIATTKNHKFIRIPRALYICFWNNFGKFDNSSPHWATIFVCGSVLFQLSAHK